MFIEILKKVHEYKKHTQSHVSVSKVLCLNPPLFYIYIQLYLQKNSKIFLGILNKIVYYMTRYKFKETTEFTTKNIASSLVCAIVHSFLYFKRNIQENSIMIFNSHILLILKTRNDCWNYSKKILINSFNNQEFVKLFGLESFKNHF